jgi:hypothetical protein
MVKLSRFIVHAFAVADQTQSVIDQGSASSVKAAKRRAGFRLSPE